MGFAWLWFTNDPRKWTEFCLLTFSWRRVLSYRNQSIDLLCKSMDWFLYGNALRHERVERKEILPATKNFIRNNSPWVLFSQMLMKKKKRQFLDYLDVADEIRNFEKKKLLNSCSFVMRLTVISLSYIIMRKAWYTPIIMCL